MNNAVLRVLTPGAWIPFERLMANARAHARRVCERWDVPNGRDVPADLRDVRGRFMLTADGHRVSGLLLDSEMQHGSDSPAVPLLLAAFPVLAALAPLLIGLLGSVGGVLVGAVLICLVTLTASAIGMLAAFGAFFVGFVLPQTGGVNLVAIARAFHGSASSADAWGAFGAQGHAAATSGGALLGGGAVAVFFVVFALFGLFSRNPIWRSAAWSLVAFAVLTVLDAAVGAVWPVLSGGSWWLVACALPLAFVFARYTARNLALMHQGNLASIASHAPLANAHIDARAQQAERAKADTSALIPLGVSRGIFTAKGDPYAPDEGLPFVVSVADLDTHLFVTGSTGTGKTTAVLKPLAAHYLGWSSEASRERAAQAVDDQNVKITPVFRSAGGMVVLDGKGALAGDFKGLRDYLLIEPGQSRLGLLEGLDPTDVVLAFTTVNQPKSESGSSKFFTTAAGEMLRHFAVFLRALVDFEIEQYGPGNPDRTWRWTLHDLHSLGVNAQSKIPEIVKDWDACITKIEKGDPSAKKAGLLADAIEYLTLTLPGMDAETRSNTWATLQGWITPAMSNKDLLPWAHVEFGVSLDRVFRGGVVGINTPRFAYGPGGTLVQALVKQRLFVHIRRRASYDWKAASETPVLFLVDEAQEIVGAEDREMLPVARSLGAICVYATQNVENLINRLGGPDEARAFLDCFRNKISFASSHQTGQWIQHDLGQTMSLAPQMSGGYIAYTQNARAVAEGPMNDPSHEGAWLSRWLSRQGAGGTSLLRRGGYGLIRHGSVEGLDPEKLALNATGIHAAEFKLQPLLLDSEWDAYTAEKFCAVAQVQRGGVRRRDIIRCKPMFQLPSELLGEVPEVGSAAAPVKKKEEPKIELRKEPRSEEQEGESTAARERTSQAFRDSLPMTAPARALLAAAEEVERTGRFDPDAFFGPRGRGR